MKKITFSLLLILASMVLFQACKPDDAGKEDTRILAYAIVQMDIAPGNAHRQKSVDVVGDSLSVHQLAVYSCLIQGPCDSNWISGAMENNEHVFFGDDRNVFIRDTVSHTFSFMHDAAVFFTEYDNDRLGVPGTERLGWLACYVEPVFCAYYDTVKGRYFNPLAEVDSLGFRWRYCRIDTLGYIPRAQMEVNRKKLLRLMDEQRFQAMIDLYKHDYHIYTCTGEEFRKMHQ